MNKTALLLIDIQEGLDVLDYYGGRRNNPEAEDNCRRLLDFFREKGWPIFHVKHNSTNSNSPLFLGQLGNNIKEIVSPQGQEPVIEKEVNSAFIGTDLQKLLNAQQIKHLIVVGLTTEHCISTTVRMAANLGFEVTVASDATAAFDKPAESGEKFSAELIHSVTLATLKDEFATIASTDQLLGSL